MAISITTAICDSFRQELLQGSHVFKSSGGSTFKILLLKATALCTGTYGPSFTNVGTPGSGAPTTSNVGTDEVTDTSGFGYYAAGGVVLTSIGTSVDTSNHIGYVYWSANPSWGPTASIVSRGCIIYNSSLGGNAVAIYDFGSDQTSVNSTFTIPLPSSMLSSSAVIRVN